MAATAIALAALFPPAPSGLLPVALADDDRPFVLLPMYTEDERPRVEAAVSALEEEMLQRARPLLSPRIVASRVHLFGSAPPPDYSLERAHDLSSSSREALSEVVSGRGQHTLAIAQQTLREAQPALEALNRETQAARHVFDTCLYAARALIDMGEPDGAYAQILQCRRMVPDLAPSDTYHPPHVVSLFRQVERNLERERGGVILRVESDPPGCPLYLNGRRIGTTPRSIAALPVGTYRVQADCSPDRPGRVHRVELGNTSTTVEIDHVYDRALRTSFEDGVALAYDDRQTLEARRYDDASKAAVHAGTHAIWVVSSEGPRTIRLDRVDVYGRVLGTALLRTSMTGKTLLHDPIAVAIEAMDQGQFWDLTEHRPRKFRPDTPRAVLEGRPPPDPAAGLDAEAAPSHADAEGSTTRPSIWNWVLAGGLVVGGAVTLISPLRTLADDGDIIREPDGTISRVEFSTFSYVLTGVGLAAIGAGVVIAILQPFTEDPGDAEPSTADPVTLEPALSPKHVGLRLRGSF